VHATSLLVDGRSATAEARWPGRALELSGIPLPKGARVEAEVQDNAGASLCNLS